MKNYLYIIENKKYGTLYAGVTEDLAESVRKHKNNLAVGNVNMFKVHELVYYEAFDDRESAVHRMKQLGTQKKKLALVERVNPERIGMVCP
jgi:putative endonuclease